MNCTIVTHSAQETIDFGKRLGSILQQGDFIAVTGELGAGKTHLAKGIAMGLGVDPSIPVTSPTYTLLNIYAGRVPFYHFDLYRLHGDEDLLDLGFEEYFFGEGACLVEWAERLQEMLPEDRLVITMSHGGGDERVLKFEGTGERGLKLAADSCTFDNEKMF